MDVPKKALKKLLAEQQARVDELRKLLEEGVKGGAGIPPGMEGYAQRALDALNRRQDGVPVVIKVMKK